MNFNLKKSLIDIGISAIVLISLIFLFHETSLDEWIAGHFYSSTTTWTYRNSFLLEKIFHKGGVIFTIVIFVSLLGGIAYTWKNDKLQKLKHLLIFIFASSALTVFSVFLLKRWSTLPCPWDCVAFGGNVTPPELWQMFSFKLANRHCFPAGHSSGGFAFLSAYFGFTYFYGRRSLKTLIPGLLIGVIFGVTQQARGAHFASHDFTTILISVLSSCFMILVYSSFYKKKIDAK